MPRYQPFLNVYVVWHPNFSIAGRGGAAVSDKLYREFGRDPEKPMSPPVGIPIYFRTSALEGSVPPSIDLDRAQHNVIVFLVDSSMVLDEKYQAYANEVAKAASNSNRHRILAFVWPKSGRLNLGNIQQIALPDSEAEADVALRMKLAAETCRLLQSRSRGSDGLSPEPPRLFISHAKRDAEDKAEELKSLVEKTPIDTFFDKVDIAAGFDFTTEIQNNIKRSAVLAWQSDEYAARPWCNVELLTAKEHRRPIVVVLGVKLGEERSFPYLGNVRTIVSTGSNSSEIIAAAVREYLRKLYAEGRFQSLAEAGLIPKTRYCLFRPPEPIDGALLERKTHDRQKGSTDEEPLPEQVLYPDPPLSTAETEVLARLFPEVQFVTPTTVDRKSLDGMKVALSISESHDGVNFGQSQIHLLGAMVEIARHVLSRGGIIAYGGDLRKREEGGFTRQLFQLVHAYKDLNRPLLERIWNFLPHHVAAELPSQEEAILLELAKFEKPLPDNLALRFNLQQGRKQVVPDDTPEHRYVRARCLTAMREVMLSKTDARIVMGGRVSGHQGKYPGILEEASLALGIKPLYLVGAFGGCTRLLILALRDKQIPPPFTREFQMSHARFAKYEVPDGSKREETVPFEQLEQSYLAYENDPNVGQDRIDYAKLAEKFQAARIADLKNGLTDDENLELFETPDLDRIISLLIKGLSGVRGSHD